MAGVIFAFMGFSMVSEDNTQRMNIDALVRRLGFGFLYLSLDETGIFSNFTVCIVDFHCGPLLGHVQRLSRVLQCLILSMIDSITRIVTYTLDYSPCVIP